MPLKKSWNSNTKTKQAVTLTVIVTTTLFWKNLDQRVRLEMNMKVNMHLYTVNPVPLVVQTRYWRYAGNWALSELQ